jgi:hypothetical protein
VHLLAALYAPDRAAHVIDVDDIPGCH